MFFVFQNRKSRSLLKAGSIPAKNITTPAFDNLSCSYSSWQWTHVNTGNTRVIHVLILIVTSLSSQIVHDRSENGDSGKIPFSLVKTFK